MSQQVGQTTKYDSITRAVFTGIFCCAVIQGGFGGLLPFLSADMSMSHTVESLHLTAISLGGVIFSLVAEPIRKRIGRFNSLLMVLGISAIGATILTTATIPAVSVFAMLLVGTAFAGILIVGQSMLVSIHKLNSARMIGEFNVVFSIAALLSILLLPVLAQSALGWRAYPGLQVLLLIVLAGPVLAHAAKSQRQLLEVAPATTGATEETTQPLAKKPIVAMATAVALEWSLVFFTALFLIDVAGITPAQGAVSTAVLLAGALAGRIVGSYFLGRFGPWPVLLGSCAIALVAIVLVLQAASPASAYAAAAVAGLAAANIYPACVGLVLHANPHAKDRVVARASLFATLSTMVWPLVVGRFADLAGMGNAVYLLLGLLALVTALLIWARPQRITATAA